LAGSQAIGFWSTIAASSHEVLTIVGVRTPSLLASASSMRVHGVILVAEGWGGRRPDMVLPSSYAVPHGCTPRSARGLERRGQPRGSAVTDILHCVGHAPAAMMAARTAE
jgi:hypothetical protein